MPSVIRTAFSLFALIFRPHRFTSIHALLCGLLLAGMEFAAIKGEAGATSEGPCPAEPLWADARVPCLGLGDPPPLLLERGNPTAPSQWFNPRACCSLGSFFSHPEN